MLTIENLPAEVLLLIFQFVSCEDLVDSVSRVNKRWKHLVSNCTTWTNKTFAPQTTMTDEEIVGYLSELPYLRHFKLQHGANVDQIVDVLCKTCPNMCSVVMERKPGPSWSRVLKLLNTYPKIKTLDLYTPDELFHLDYAKLFGTNPTANSLYMFGDKVVRNLNKLFGEKWQTMATTRSEEEMIRVLAERAGGLEYLAICSRIREKITSEICKCTKLKKLFLFSDEEERDAIDIEKLMSLERLESLQMYLSYGTRVTLGGISPNSSSRLVKLEICCMFSLSNFEARNLWGHCPNLRYIRLRAGNLLDEAFQGIGKCKYLKHIDLSYNDPGFYNTALELIAEGCKELEFLDVSYSYNVIFYNLKILRTCPKLKYLWLRNQGILLNQLAKISTYFPRLVELNLVNCKKIDKGVLEDLKHVMPNLRVVTGRTSFS